ncbi:hypothetical protein L210DRAFT_989995 [Boletus edulis BED1]|uniref:TPR-like protein n=1 Tax=Boletus edulis BED1 TaxID=1328754 RepID=A0AAD4BNT6_BOLED|nr:hypothetical protein L210DRAFT_989995 [Boletus edulis BED1]
MDPKAQQLHLRADSLAGEFQRGGETSYIDETIKLDREALELHPPGHPERTISLTWLAIHFNDCYNQLGSIWDLEEAIVLDRDALDLHPHGHPCLVEQPCKPSLRSVPPGWGPPWTSMRPFDREALDLRPKGHPDQSTSLNNHAVDLSIRYEQVGVMEDLDEAIALSHEALDLCPKGHPDRSMSLSNLATRLSIRYQQLSLATHLSTRYKQLGVVGDLEEAIALGRQALELRPEGHPNRSTSLNNVAADLSARYKQLGGTEDLDEAIAISAEKPSSSPEMTPRLVNIIRQSCKPSL